MSNVIEKSFTREELLRRFRDAAAQCARSARERYCAGPLPEELLFVVPEVGPELRTMDEVVDHVWRSDGWHRPDIRISPVAVTSEALVIDVSWNGAFTNRLLTGELAFPSEPFIVNGPELPSDWDPDGSAPMPRVVLRRWDQP